jgi:uncharacterized protein
VIYVDPSALVRAYLGDEAASHELHTLLLTGPGIVLTSEISRVEMAAAIRTAGRAGRLAEWELVLRRVDADMATEGPVHPIALRSEPVIGVARQLVLDHKLRTLDAIHVAVALEDGRTLARDDELVFVTRDADQASAARALGLAVA